MNKAQYLKEEIRRLELDLKTAKSSLDLIERECNHNWTSTEYTPEIEKGYTIQGSRSRYYGDAYIPYDEVPYMNDTHVPDKRIDKWTRKCLDCGKVEVTTEATEKVTTNKIPKF